eukprot:98472_1
MLPIEIGFALTIEGVQGLEFLDPEDIIITDITDLNKIGGFYTLESRVKATEQIYFINKPDNWNELIKIHPYVTQFYTKLKNRKKGNYVTPSINKCSKSALKNKINKINIDSDGDEKQQIFNPKPTKPNALANKINQHTSFKKK